METPEKTIITVKSSINAPMEKVWKHWTTPSDIVRWNNASDDWHTTKATNDLRVGGIFSSRMEAKDGSMGFDFEGVYSTVSLHDCIEYGMSDGRKVKILFKDLGTSVEITESFDAESIHPPELQQEGWQAILNNFKAYTESNPF
jgi:uncharacterized protein YndB with AHSA1/START domain